MPRSLGSAVRKCHPCPASTHASPPAKGARVWHLPPPPLASCGFWCNRDGVRKQIGCSRRGETQPWQMEEGQQRSVIVRVKGRGGKRYRRSSISCWLPSVESFLCSLCSVCREVWRKQTPSCRSALRRGSVSTAGAVCLDF